MDPVGLIAAIVFVAGGLSLIPLNEWLDRRAARRRRQQAHSIRKEGRW